jgi:hypothetical protein
METRYEILELARFLTELSVIDYFFVPHKASDVALAALLNSIEAVATSTSTSESSTMENTIDMMAIQDFQQELSRVRGGLDPNKLQVQECRIRLQVLYTQGGYSRPETSIESRNATVSPVCVSFGTGMCDPYPRNYETPATVVVGHDHSVDHTTNDPLTTVTTTTTTSANNKIGIDDLEREVSPTNTSSCLRTNTTVQTLHYENGIHDIDLDELLVNPSTTSCLRTTSATLQNNLHYENEEYEFTTQDKQ